MISNQVKLSELPLGSELTGAEFFEIVQDGENKRIPISALHGVVNEESIEGILASVGALQQSVQTLPGVKTNIEELEDNFATLQQNYLQRFTGIETNVGKLLSENGAESVLAAKINTLETNVTTLLAKAAKVVYVSDHGAIGDGAVDDSAAFVAAAIAAGRGGAVALDKGKTYRLGSAVSFGECGILIGNGATIRPDKSVISAGGYAIYMGASLGTINVPVGETITVQEHDRKLVLPAGFAVQVGDLLFFRSPNTNPLTGYSYGQFSIVEKVNGREVVVTTPFSAGYTIDQIRRYRSFEKMEVTGVKFDMSNSDITCMKYHAALSMTGTNINVHGNILIGTLYAHVGILVAGENAHVHNNFCTGFLNRQGETDNNNNPSGRTGYAIQNNANNCTVSNNIIANCKHAVAGGPRSHVIWSAIVENNTVSEDIVGTSDISPALALADYTGTIDMHSNHANMFVCRNNKILCWASAILVRNGRGLIEGNTIAQRGHQYAAVINTLEQGFDELIVRNNRVSVLSDGALVAFLYARTPEAITKMENIEIASNIMYRGSLFMNGSRCPSVKNIKIHHNTLVDGNFLAYFNGKSDVIEDIYVENNWVTTSGQYGMVQLKPTLGDVEGFPVNQRIRNIVIRNNFLDNGTMLQVAAGTTKVNSFTVPIPGAQAHSIDGVLIAGNTQRNARAIFDIYDDNPPPMSKVVIENNNVTALATTEAYNLFNLQTRETIEGPMKTPPVEPSLNPFLFDGLIIRNNILDMRPNTGAGYTLVIQKGRVDNFILSGNILLRGNATPFRNFLLRDIDSNSVFISGNITDGDFVITNFLKSIIIDELMINNNRLKTLTITESNPQTGKHTNNTPRTVKLTNATINANSVLRGSLALSADSAALSNEILVAGNTVQSTTVPSLSVGEYAVNNKVVFRSNSVRAPIMDYSKTGYRVRPRIRPSLMLDFTKFDKLDPRVTYTRFDTAWYYNALGQVASVPANISRRSFDPLTGQCVGLVVETGRTNYLLNSEAPATQIVNITAAGKYTLSMLGAGSVTVAANTALGTGFGSANQNTPLTIDVTTPGTIDVTVTGNVKRFQLENGLDATSPIVTTNAIFNRAADKAVIRNLLSYVNSDEFSVYVEFYPIKSSAVSATQAAFSIGALGSNLPRLELVRNTANNRYNCTFLDASGASMGSGVSFPADPGVIQKFVISCKDGEVITCANGGAPMVSASGVTPFESSGFDVIALGARTPGNNVTGVGNVTIRKIMVYPKALTRAEAQALTF